MSYQALYRVWRPQRFDELVGQEVITTTLKNAIITNQISHAYLFAGPRGTGKTSAAKIFAKAINCPNAKDGEPCNECVICKAITKGTLNDVIEIDAASNNGVEEIRDVRDKAKYAPTEAQYKVYIIDEVHMLSIGAFNALLKTLEEPPANVIFILATTEPHKIPATIISRTQRFDFKRIKPQAILNRMEYILGQKDLKYDDQALRVIAKAAEGGMRDALSILDQTLSYGDDTVTYQNALQVTGSVTKELLHDYFGAVIDQNVKTALVDVQKIFDAGKDVNQFIDDMINYCQDILLYRQSPEMVEKAELGVLDETFKADAQSVSEQILYQIIEQLNAIQYQMHFSNHPDVYLEVLTVKIATLPQNNTVEQATVSADESQFQDLNQQIKSLQNQVAELRQSTTKNVKINHATAKHEVNDVQDDVSHQDAASDQPLPIPNVTSVYGILNQATKKDLTRMRDAWQELLASLDVVQRSMMNVSDPVAASEDGVVVNFSYDFFYQRATGDQELMDTLQNGLSRIIGYAPKIVFINEAQWKQLRTNYLNQRRSKKSVKPAEPVAKQSTPVTDDDKVDSTSAVATSSVQSSEPRTRSTESVAPEPSSEEVHGMSAEQADVAKSDDKAVAEAASLFGTEVLNVKDD